ncbi:MAG: ABC transporter substrate-binding protein [Bauldia sp.]|nr:MAG: ABC transporter substrate-binding protein [Bauldia sp.]
MIFLPGSSVPPGQTLVNAPSARHGPLMGGFRSVVAAALVSLVGAAPAWATLYPAPSGNADARAVLIYSALDESIARPLIHAFQKANPDLAVDYRELQTIEIYDRIIRETDAGGETADVAVSSAMDLQVKLANDGYAQAINPASAAALPRWAIWRNTAFALTFEPAAIVYNKAAFKDVPPPRTHAELTLFLKNAGNDFYGRIGTYDIERAGVGFLFLARDLEHYRDTWDLVRAMGAAGVKLYSNSSAILERVADGRFALGYNILGSYAAAWAETAPDLGIILPSDYTVVMSRIGLVPEAAGDPDLGERFLDFLMSEEGQRVMAREVRLPAIHPNVRGDDTIGAMQAALGAQLQPVPVSPGLLVYLDQVKRARLILRWNDALRGR